MHVVRAFVGVHHLQVHQVAGHAVFVADAVAAHHVAGHAGDVQRLAAAVALEDAGDLHRGRAFVLHAAQAQAALQAQAYFGQHVGQLFLDQLVGGQGAAELLAVHHVLAGAEVAVFGRAQRAPGDAVTRTVQAGERALETAHIRKGVFFRHEDLVHDDFAGDAGAQADLAVHGRGGEALPALFQDEAADLAAVVLGPDHEHVGDRRVGDPHLGAGQAVAAVDLAGAGDHAAGVAAVVGFGQAEAADPFTRGQLGQVLLLLRFAAEFVDRHHHQRALHAHHGAVARIHALDLARHQAVADVVEAGAAVLLGDGRAQQAQLAHLAEDGRVGGLVAEGQLHARQQLFLAVGAGGVLHLALVVGELGAEVEGVFPAEGVLARGHGAGLRWKGWKVLVGRDCRATMNSCLILIAD